MQQPVQDGGGDDAVAEHLAPGAETLVACQDHGATLVAAAYQLEEQVGPHLGSYFGVIGPGGLAKALGNRISKDIAKALASPEVQARLDGLQLVAVGSTPEAFEQLVRKDMQTMARLVQATGLSAE